MNSHGPMSLLADDAGADDAIGAIRWGGSGTIGLRSAALAGRFVDGDLATMIILVSNGGSGTTTGG